MAGAWKFSLHKEENYKARKSLSELLQATEASPSHALGLEGSRAPTNTPLRALLPPAPGFQPGWTRLPLPAKPLIFPPTSSVPLVAPGEGHMAGGPERCPCPVSTYRPNSSLSQPTSPLLLLQG